MINRNAILFSILLVLLLTACVPESDLERAAGGRNASGTDQPLTPIPESDVPEIRPLELNVVAVDLQRAAGQMVAQVTLGASIDARVEFAGTGQIEWSDGETTAALPSPAGGLLIESRRSDPGQHVVPVSLYLTRITYLAGSDVHAEFRQDEIATDGGDFPVLSVDQVGRPPGWQVSYQAAGMRWISRMNVIHEGRHRPADGEINGFDDDFRPVSGSLRFGLEFEEFQDDLPLVAMVDIRVAIPVIELDL